LTFEGTDSCL
jgi:hypothetical protein